MFADFLEYRRMKLRIRELNKAFYSLGNPLEHMDEVKRIRIELEPLEDRFDLLETGRLERKTQRLCIEMPRDRQGWWRQVNIEKVTDGGFNLAISVLSPQGQRGIRKLMREERFRVIKRWAELLIPILSLIIAILALTRK